MLSVIEIGVIVMGTELAQEENSVKLLKIRAQQAHSAAHLLMHSKFKLCQCSWVYVCFALLQSVNQKIECFLALSICWKYAEFQYH